MTIPEKPIYRKFLIFSVLYLLLALPIYFFWTNKVILKGFWFTPFWIFSSFYILVLFLLDIKIEFLKVKKIGFWLFIKALLVAHSSSILGLIFTTEFNNYSKNTSAHLFSHLENFSHLGFSILVYPFLTLLVVFCLALEFTDLFLRKNNETQNTGRYRQW